MSFSTPRGRHRAPNKLNSAARASVAAAATGSIVAAIAMPSASAASNDVSNAQVAAVAADAANASVATAKQSVTISSDVKTVLASVTSAKPQLGTVQAKGLVVRAQRSVAAASATPAAPSRSTAQSSDRSTQNAAAEQTTRRSATATSRSTSRTSLAAETTTARATSSTRSAAQSGAVQSEASTAGVSRSGAVGIAMQYLGVPYVFGGASPSGFDCSGLTGYVYSQLGMSLPRTAAAQQSSLRSVSNPQPGDLVFFGYPAHHVGIYAGNGMMIAAPYPGTVVRLQKIWDTPSGYGRP